MASTTVADQHSGLSPADLAARYGLTAAGARPGLITYSKSLWRYRHFITAYANGRVTASFSKARLGRVWQVLTPLTNAAIYYLIFGVVLGTSRGVDNFIAYLCIGLFVFVFSQTVVASSVQAIAGNLGLIRALQFPRGCLPLALTIVQLQNLLASMLVLLGIVLVTREPIGPQWLLVLPAMVLQALFNAGLGMVVARLGAKLPDLKQVLPFVLRTWMYASGVLYSVDLFAAHLPKWAAQIMHLNPLLIYIELFRDALLESTPLTSLTTLQRWSFATGWALLLGIGGFIYFWRGEKEYGRG